MSDQNAIVDITDHVQLIEGIISEVVAERVEEMARGFWLSLAEALGVPFSLEIAPTLIAMIRDQRNELAYLRGAVNGQRKELRTDRQKLIDLLTEFRVGYTVEDEGSVVECVSGYPKITGLSGMVEFRFMPDGRFTGMRIEE